MSWHASCQHPCSCTYHRRLTSCLSALKLMENDLLWLCIYSVEKMCYSGQMCGLQTFHQHLQRLQSIFSEIRSAGPLLKPERCHFGYTEPKFLGHVVSHDGIRPDPEKTPLLPRFLHQQTWSTPIFILLCVLQELCGGFFKHCGTHNTIYSYASGDICITDL